MKAYIQQCLILIGLTVSAIQPALAEDDVITIEGTRIRGNQELPTILYLIPWQAPEVQQLDAPQQSFAVQRPLELLERQEFRRLIGYYEVFLDQLPEADKLVSEPGS